MDTKIRQLERRAASDPDALARLIAEKQRLGYQEKQEAITRLPLSCATLEEFNSTIQESLAEQRGKYHSFFLSFEGISNCEIEYDYYGDS